MRHRVRVTVNAGNGAPREAKTSYNHSNSAIRPKCRYGPLAAVTMSVAIGCQSDQVGSDRELWYDPDTPQWTVEGSASYTLTAVAMPSDTIQLFGIGRAMFTDKGDILVTLYKGEQQIVSLDTLGQFRWKAGRTGEGPGEFKSISDLVSVGDATHVWDGARRTVAIFEGATFVREIDVAAKGGRRVIGIVADSLILAAPGITARTEGEVRRYEMWNGRAQRIEAEAAPTVEGWRGSQGNLAALPITYDGGGHTVRTELPACIVGMTEVSVGGVVYVANVEGAPGRVYALEPASGRQRSVYETNGGPLVTELLVEDIRARFRKLVESAKRPSRGPGGVEEVRTNVRLVEDSVTAILNRIGAVGALAATTWMDLVADETAGHLWLRRAACSEDAEQEWEIINTEGQLVARAVLPNGLQVRDVRYPRILVTTADALGVEQLSILKLDTASHTPRNN